MLVPGAGPTLDLAAAEGTLPLLQGWLDAYSGGPGKLPCDIACETHLVFAEEMSSKNIYHVKPFVAFNCWYAYLLPNFCLWGLLSSGFVLLINIPDYLNC